MTQEKEVVIEVKNVGFGYRSNDPILRLVSLTVERGDFFGIIGTNGSGKTTLLKMILGLLKPDSGEVKIFGENPLKSTKRSRIGYISQAAVQFDRSFPATAYEVVLMGRVARAGLFRRLTANDKKKARTALKEVGLEQLADRKVGELSGGQQQRVIIARALAGDPELMIFDEPTLGVDVNAEAEFYKLLRHLNVEHGLTLVVVTHDLDIIGHQVNKLMCMHCSISTHGTPQQFLQGEALHTAAQGNIQLVPHHESHHDGHDDHDHHDHHDRH
jgi:zinc transport system ATP-binding protein